MFIKKRDGEIHNGTNTMVAVNLYLINETKLWIDKDSVKIQNKKLDCNG